MGQSTGSSSIGSAGESTPPAAAVSGRWARLNALVHEALERPTAERRAFLARCCDDDEALRREAEELVGIEPDRVAALDGPLVDLRDDWRDETKSDAAPDRVGVYRLDSVIGRGGTGTVYLGVRDDDEFEHRVAVKILKRGMDTDEIVRRFRTERQILANLEHPNIAELHGGGTTLDHRPYFVMELVDGLPIDRYCDHHRLDVRRRLELVLKVCDAVSLAHQNLIVHRDLKPSNILVDADGEPKLLDFGIAKLLDPETGSSGTVTATGWRMMTPEFASPEQVRGDPITTASDVYALGVLLYELLTGRRPYTLERRAPQSVFRAVCETVPERPSSRVGERDADALAALRRATPTRLRRRLRGDLDTIVAVALRKDPRRRYSSVRHLAEDLRLHLDGLPIRARRDTVTYRLGKLLRRRRKEAVALLVAVTALAWLVVDRLEQQERTAVQRDRAERVTELLVGLFEVADPEAAAGAEITAREILDRGVVRLDQELTDEPELRATLLATMCRVYRNLGLYDRALPLAETSLELRRERGTPLERAESLDDLASIQFQLGRYAEAEANWREALALREARLGAAHPDTLQNVNDLALSLWKLGRLEDAEPLLRSVVEAERARHGPGHLGVTLSLNNLALLRQEQGALDEAAALLEESLEIKRAALGGDHPRVALALNNLAVLHLEAGRLDDADELLAEVLELARTIYGDEHPRVAATLGSIAAVHRERGDLETALALLERSYVMRRAVMPEDSPALAAFSLRLVKVERDLGRRDEALARARDARSVLETSDHPAAQEARELIAELSVE